MSILSKLTLIMPTYNRHTYVLRNMRYWSGREVTVLVLDGSDQPINATLLEGIAGNIRYHHLPISIHERLFRSTKLIDTEYSALYGDDEFFSRIAVEKCINELENDKSLVSCVGRCIGFNPTDVGIVGRPWYSDMKDYKLLLDDPIERMVFHMGNYNGSTIYSIIRTPVWKHAVNMFSKKLFTVFSMEEYIFEMVVAFMGKSKVIPILYWYRSLENERIIQNENKFHVWWNSISDIEEKETFISFMVDSLSIYSDINKINLRNGVIRTGDAFTKVTSPSLKESVSIKPSLGKRIFYFALRKYDDFKRFVYAKNTSIIKIDKKKFYPFHDALNLLKNEGVIVNQKENQEIEEIVMDFYNQEQKKESQVHE